MAASRPKPESKDQKLKREDSSESSEGVLDKMGSFFKGKVAAMKKSMAKKDGEEEVSEEANKEM